MTAYANNLSNCVIHQKTAMRFDEFFLLLLLSPHKINFATDITQRPYFWHYVNMQKGFSNCQIEVIYGSFQFCCFLSIHELRALLVLVNRMKDSIKVQNISKMQFKRQKIDIIFDVLTWTKRPNKLCFSPFGELKT